MNVQEDSILASVKLALGITIDYEFFDPQLVQYVNTVLAVLVQTGVGPEEGFVITGPSETWMDFLGDDHAKIEYAKSYVIMRVRMLFDPPQSSGAMKSMEEMIREFEWRGYVECDPTIVPEET
jgi:hypothetical protein